MSDTSAEVPAAEVDAMEAAKAKVNEFLSSFEDVDIEDDETRSLQYGSARVYITVGEFDEDEAVVQVRAECVKGATLSPELYRHVATYQGELGHLTVAEADDGTGTICYSRTLLAEFLNPAELRMSVVAVALIADRLDDDLAATFGGTVYDAAANQA